MVSVAFSPDGRTLATVGYDRPAVSYDDAIILWDVTDPANPRRLGQPLSGHSLVFSPDGHTLATGDGNGSVILWDLTGLNDLRDRATELACAKTGRSLDRDEWDRYIPGLAYQDTCSG